jgi:predicted lipid-binding transport protein (Tim44 family)
MKKAVVIFSLAMMVLSTQEALAKRIGGGMSFGRSSPNVTNRYQAPAKPAPTQNTANNATSPSKQATNGAPTAAQPTRSRWGGMLGGLAAGLGLAWLASSLGLGAEFGQILLIALLVFAAIFLIRRFLGGARAPQYAAQGAGSAPTAPSYNSGHVGNDAAARPWEQSNAAFDSAPATTQASGSMIGSAISQGAPTAVLSGNQSWGVPDGFDTEGFLRACKNNFVQLQAAWDASDITKLKSLMTDEMLREIQQQLVERDANAHGQPNVTEVVSLEANLLGIEELPEEYMASVEFSGMIKEDPRQAATPFREVWNIIKSKQRGGWVVAGVQALG